VQVPKTQPYNSPSMSLPAIESLNAFVGFLGLLMSSTIFSNDFLVTVILGGIMMSAGNSRSAWR